LNRDHMVRIGGTAMTGWAFSPDRQRILLKLHDR
jgi:hypothetical protein